MYACPPCSSFPSRSPTPSTECLRQIGPGTVTADRHLPGRSPCRLLTSHPMSAVEVTHRIEAPRERVWEVGDPVAMAGITAECEAMEWVGEPAAPAVGARFRGRNRSGRRRWTTTCTIVRYEPGSEIAWDATFGPLPIARWSYRLEPVADGRGTVVEERFEDHRGAIMRATAPGPRHPGHRRTQSGQHGGHPGPDGPTGRVVIRPRSSSGRAG
jgi:hypothetical protein